MLSSSNVSIAGHKRLSFLSFQDVFPSRKFSQNPIILHLPPPSPFIYGHLRRYRDNSFCPLIGHSADDLTALHVVICSLGVTFSCLLSVLRRKDGGLVCCCMHIHHAIWACPRAIHSFTSPFEQLNFYTSILDTRMGTLLVATPPPFLDPAVIPFF